MTAVTEPAFRPARSAKRPLRLLFVTEFLEPAARGGVSRLVTSLGEALLQQGHGVSAVAQAATDRPTPPKVHGFPVTWFATDGTSTHRHMVSTIRRSHRAVVQALRNDTPDAIIAMSNLSTVGALLARGTDGPPIVQLNAGPWHKEWLVEVARRAEGRSAQARLIEPLWRFLFYHMERLIQRYYFAQVERIFVLSRYMHVETASLMPRSEARKIRSLRPGIDPARFALAPDRAAVRQMLGLPIDATILLTVRRLAPRMGLETLLDAFGQILAARPGTDLRLVIVGEGTLRQVLTERRAELGLTDRVRLVGFVDDSALPRYYQAADLFVLPTETLEGFGLIILEALACGTPVVGTPVNAIPEVLGEVDPEMIMDGIDTAALVRGLVVGLDRIVPNWPAEARRKQITDRYSWDGMASRIADEVLALKQERFARHA